MLPPWRRAPLPCDVTHILIYCYILPPLPPLSVSQGQRSASHALLTGTSTHCSFIMHGASSSPPAHALRVSATQAESTLPDSEVIASITHLSQLEDGVCLPIVGFHDDHFMSSITTTCSSFRLPVYRQRSMLLLCVS